MRIISGNFRAKRIHVPKKFNGRPTTDFAKESLFNILNNRIDYESVNFLDLFAGTGAISYEFVSRGCLEVRAVDSSIVHTNFINAMFRELKAPYARCLKKDAFMYIANSSETFDVIFADPPYDLTDLDTLPDLIFRDQLLKKDGIFILEHDKEYNFSRHPFFLESRKYGHVNFSFFERKPEDFNN